MILKSLPQKWFELSILGLWCTGAQSLAAEPSDTRSGPEQLGLADLAQWSMGLLVVLLTIFACAWLVRKVTGLSSPIAGTLRVLGGVSLGSREKAILLQVGGRKLLLGVTPGRVQTLYVLDDDDSLAVDSQRPDPNQRDSFVQRLHSAMQGDKHGSV